MTTFANLVNKINYVTDKDGQVIAVQIDITVWKQILTHLQNAGEITAEQAFGLWKDRIDIDDEWLENSRKQWESDWQP